MALAPLQVLIYALAIAGKPVPTECTLKAPEKVVCTNGMTATEAPNRSILFNDKVLVTPGMDGSLMFSNGIKATMGSAGWIRFSSGVSARRDPGTSGGFIVSPDLLCTDTAADKAECRRR